MLAKKYRLKEREVKKVLHKGKPFFSYSVVFNVFPNRLGYTRFAIVIWWKSVPTNVVRNIYRRKFYDISSDHIKKNSKDIVCVVKSKTKLWKTQHDIKKIESEIHYLFEKKIWKNI